MRATQSASIDFNQMLVVSVFFHFLFFTVVMFLPATQEIVRRIKPPIMVKMVNLPAGPEAPPTPPVKETPVVPQPKSKPVPEKPVIKKEIPEKPVPDKPSKPNPLLSKLDQVSKMEKRIPEKKVPPKPKIQNPKKEVTAKLAPKPVENVFEGFEDIKMKSEAKKKNKPTRKRIAKNDLALKELEFEQLSKKTAKDRPREKPKKSSSLLKDLDDLNKMNQQASVALDKPKPRKTEPHSKASKLLKEMESLKKEKVQIKIDTSKLTVQHSTKFKSEIRNLKIAKNPVGAPVPSSSGDAGEPAADVLSKYVGEVYAKIYANWKDPLGGGSGSVQIAFSIFPKGNIATPKIMVSSGDSKLDNLAVRAVKNAAPLPPFPKEIKEPNLPLILKFEYVPSKS